MLNHNYEDIKIELEAFADKYLENSTGVLELLDTLHEKSSKVDDAQKIELLAASIAYIYLKQHQLNGRGGITTKDVGAFFRVKPATISSKVMDIEFYLNGGKVNIRPNEPYIFYDTTNRYDVSQMYWNFLERNEKDIEKNIKALQKLIQKDPDFFDSYISLYEYYYANHDFENAVKTLKRGYQKAMDLVMNNGRFPDELEWGYIENRHIIRMIFHYGMFLWEIGEQEKALAVFMQLLKSNINDNIGVRYTIVAMLEGFTSMGEYESKFASTYGLDAMAVEKWFYEASQKHKEVIGWWFDAVDYEE